MFRSKFLLLALAAAVAAPRSMPVPKTRTDSVSETIHGVTIRDPYRWLEDQQSPETRAWIDAQNAYSQSVLGPLPGRNAIQKRLEQLLKTDRFGLPTVHMPLLFPAPPGVSEPVHHLFAQRRERHGRSPDRSQ
jgi:protease II